MLQIENDLPHFGPKAADQVLQACRNLESLTRLTLVGFEFESRVSNPDDGTVYTPRSLRTLEFDRCSIKGAIWPLDVRLVLIRRLTSPLPSVMAPVGVVLAADTAVPESRVYTRWVVPGCCAPGSVLAPGVTVLECTDAQLTLTLGHNGRLATLQLDSACRLPGGEQIVFGFGREGLGLGLGLAGRWESWRWIAPEPEWREPQVVED